MTDGKQQTAQHTGTALTWRKRAGLGLVLLLSAPTVHGIGHVTGQVESGLYEQCDYDYLGEEQVETLVHEGYPYEFRGIPAYSNSEFSHFKEAVYTLTHEGYTYEYENITRCSKTKRVILGSTGYISVRNAQGEEILSYESPRLDSRVQAPACRNYPPISVIKLSATFNPTLNKSRERSFIVFCGSTDGHGKHSTLRLFHPDVGFLTDLEFSAYDSPVSLIRNEQTGHYISVVHYRHELSYTPNKLGWDITVWYPRVYTLKFPTTTEPIHFSAEMTDEVIPYYKAEIEKGREHLKTGDYSAEDILANMIVTTLFIGDRDTYCENLDLISKHLDQASVKILSSELFDDFKNELHSNFKKELKARGEIKCLS